MSNRCLDKNESAQGAKVQVAVRPLVSTDRDLATIACCNLARRHQGRFRSYLKGRDESSFEPTKLP
jgi:hypothetical protein